MCLAVYIASNKQLPLIPWVEKNPSFCVIELTKNENGVKKQFSLEHVYYVGSHEGCGCGFFKEGEAGEELVKIEENYNRLSTYILNAKENNSKIELFSCWEGDQASKVEKKEKITENTLKEKLFEFKEKWFYEVQ